MGFACHWMWNKKKNATKWNERWSEVAGWPCIFRNSRLVLSVWHLPSCGFDATSPFPLDAVLFKTLQSFTSLMLISSSAMSPKGESPRTAANDTFQNKQCTIREVFKWLSKVITRLRLLRFVIGWKNLCQYFNQWQAKPNPNHTLYARFFPHFEQVTGNCQEFWLVHCAVCSLM